MGGMEIFIRGTDFHSTDEIEIKIGGRLCPLNQNLTNDMTIVCYVPAAATRSDHDAFVQIMVRKHFAICSDSVCLIK